MADYYDDLWEKLLRRHTIMVSDNDLDTLYERYGDHPAYIYLASTCAGDGIYHAWLKQPYTYYEEEENGAL